MKKPIYLFSIVFVLAYYVTFCWPGNTSYNCHSYALHHSMGDGTPEAPWLPRWDDDISDELATAVKLDAPVPGSWLVYGDKAHSATYLGHGWAVSKMGSMLILVHPVKAIEWVYGPLQGAYQWQSNS
jgi:hypothetical protein